MSEPAVIRGSYADLKLVRSRKVCQIVVEAPLEHLPAIVAAFGAPDPAAEVPVVVARLVMPSSNSPEQASTGGVTASPAAPTTQTGTRRAGDGDPLVGRQDACPRDSLRNPVTSPGGENPATHSPEGASERSVVDLPRTARDGTTGGDRRESPAANVSVGVTAGETAPSPARRHPLRLSQRVGKTCWSPTFQAWLRTRHAAAWDRLKARGWTDEQVAADFVRSHCRVESRSEIVDGSEAAERWNTLEADFEVAQRSHSVRVA